MSSPSQCTDTPLLSWHDLLRSLLFFLKGRQRSFIFWTITLFIVFFYQLLPPLLIAGLIDFFSNYKTGDSLQPFYLYVASLGGSHAIASLIRLTAKDRLNFFEIEATHNAKVQGFERLVNFNLRWHDEENTGNKIQRIQQGVEAIKQLRHLATSEVFKSVASITGSFAAFLILNPPFSLFVVVYFVMFVIIDRRFHKRLVLLRNQENVAQEQASGAYFEGLNNILTIKSLGAKDSFRKSISQTEDAAKHINQRIRVLGHVKWKVFQVFNAAMITIYLLFVGNGVLAGAITIGSIFIYYSYLMRLQESVGGLTEMSERLIQQKSAIARMMPLYWESQQLRHGSTPFPPRWKTLKIKQGVFHYTGKDSDEKEFSLHNLTFSLQRGEKIGVVGSSGSGKSTLAKLLLGVYEIDRGTFTIDRIPFYEIDTDDLSKRIAIVLQESELFNLSLQDNITLLKDVDEATLLQAIEIAHLGPVIQKLPNGLQTLIGEKGYRLSGGERQRVGLARAIFKHPDILVLDEATSALDTKTEQLIQASLEEHLKDTTLVMIAHRISTLKHVDRICVFEKGTIVEEGTYQDLITDRSSKFFEVYQSSQKGMEHMT